MPPRSLNLARTRLCTCSALRRASRAVTAHYEHHFRGSGLRATQFTILSHLAQTGPIAMTELAVLLGMERTTLTRNLSLLSSKAWITAAEAPDGRVRKVAITARGEAMVAKTMPRWLAAEASVHRLLKELRLPQLPPLQVQA